MRCIPSLIPCHGGHPGPVPPHPSFFSLSHADQARLRASCRYLGGAVAPLFFARFVLRVDRVCSGDEDSLVLLRRIARGENGWARWARTLRVVPGAEDELVHATATMQQVLAAALASMANIRTVVWTAQENGPLASWLSTMVWDALHKLPLLEDLDMKLLGKVPLSLPDLASLRRLKIVTWPYYTARARSADNVGIAPELLSLQNWQPPMPLALQVASVGRQLTSLQLFGLLDRELSAVWTALRNERVHLKEITAAFQLVSSDFVAYIGSYSGVEKLHLFKPGSGGAMHAELDTLARRFYNDALDKHAATLTEFCCTVEFACAWCFGSLSARTVAGLRKLRRLEMGIAAERAKDDVVRCSPPS
ncbi:hypothetical protein GGX14DRAFT_440937 [Mycena pura]|uniref:F-box domain-containing protein n=1 Tax=Mycena pura TaxID=153505 RepID=A0AAD6VMB8_9AGAR|nr:hypothetical protein GGX14DRAFT_440937 [Mycena pura]